VSAPESGPVVELRVRVQPRAARSEVVAWREGVLAVRLTAPPVDGAANAACRDFLADALGLRRGAITLVAGERSRDKRFRILGLSEEEVRARLAAPEA
jgi:uncharacterized protein (TIGR00251 family)